MKEKIISGVVAASLLTTGTASIAHGMDQNDNEIKEPIFIKGGNLDQNQTDETKDELGVKRNTKSIEIDAEEVSNFTHHPYSTIYSSAYIEPKTFGSGVDVDIVTDDTITSVSEAQYMNAAVSAGIQNANIKVGSVNTVTGEGALTGIYKAYENEDQNLNEIDVDNASDEINSLSSISKNHKDDPNYSDSAMNNAVANMKGDVAKEKKNNDDVSDQKINNIRDDELEDKKLDNVLSDDEKAEITNILINVKNSNVVNKNPDNFIKQTDHITKKVSDSIKDKADNLKYEHANKDKDNDEGWLSSIWNTIKSWFN